MNDLENHEANAAERTLPARTATTFRRRRLSTVGECAYCDAERNGSGFHPHHDASDRCESGKHNHCTCDTCF